MVTGAITGVGVLCAQALRPTVTATTAAAPISFEIFTRSV